MLEEDAIRFDTFLKENDKKAHEAIKKAERETKVTYKEVVSAFRLSLSEIGLYQSTAYALPLAHRLPVVVTDKCTRVSISRHSPEPARYHTKYVLQRAEVLVSQLRLKSAGPLTGGTVLSLLSCRPISFDGRHLSKVHKSTWASCMIQVSSPCPLSLHRRHG